MKHLNHARTAAIIGVLALTFGACRQKRTAPELETSTGVQPRSQPTTVVGCLRSGVAENTFVLMTANPDTGSTATYQIAAHDGVNLRDYVGQKVEAAGTIRAEEAVASTSGTTPEKPAKNAAGKPAVETKTDLDVKEFTADSVKPIGRRCD